MIALAHRQPEAQQAAASAVLAKKNLGLMIKETRVPHQTVTPQTAEAEPARFLAPESRSHDRLLAALCVLAAARAEETTSSQKSRLPGRQRFRQRRTDRRLLRRRERRGPLERRAAAEQAGHDGLRRVVGQGGF